MKGENMKKGILVYTAAIFIFFMAACFLHAQEELPAEEQVSVDVYNQDGSSAETQSEASELPSASPSGGQASAPAKTELSIPSQNDLPDAIKTRLNAFFTQLEAANVEVAVSDLVKNTLLENKTQELNLVVNQLKNLPIIYGPILDIKPISTKYVGDSLFMSRYLVRLRDHPAIFEFYFYKAQSDWTLLKFWFNDQMQSLF